MQSHSLPTKPPPPASGSLPSFKPAFSAAPSTTAGAPGTNSQNAGSGNNQGSWGLNAFKPRAVASNNQGWQQSKSPTISAGPTVPPHFQNQSFSSYQQAPSHYPQQGGYQQSGFNRYDQRSPPQAQTPFPAPPPQFNQGQYGGDSGKWGNPNYDPEMEAQIAQWQSAYVSTKDETGNKGTGVTAMTSSLGNNRTNNGPDAMSSHEATSVAKPDSGVAAVVAGPDGQQKTVVRSGGGQSWTDSSLLEWDPAHFRLFVGNLAGEVTDESLLKAFSKYPSVQKSRVVRDKRTTKSKGFGFVSFSDGDEYFQAAKEMQGKYIGSHPVLLRKSTTEIKPVNPVDKKKKKGGRDGGQHGKNTDTGAGVQKKNRKTKGGLKILG
ncbi:MAG: RNA-binding protein 42 [Alyxoria varia]|nr:MAG: RNA-binding protein 42 [Alyxoria varia]